MHGNVCRIAVIGSFLFLIGCGSPQHDAKERYVLIANNTSVPYWKAAVAGMSRAGGSMGVKTEVAGPEKYDPETEHKEFQRILQTKPTGILVSAGNSKLIQPDIDAAIAQGVPVITVDSDVEDSKRLLFIGTDNYKAGSIGGHIVAKRLNGKGTVVFYTMPDQPNLHERLHGYQDVFATFPGIKTTRVVDTKGDATVAFDTTKQMVEKGVGQIDAFVCLESTSCPEVAEVLDRSHVANKVVVAMDTDPRTLEWIGKGLITATIGQKPFTMCFFGLKMLDDLHHHSPGSLDKKWNQDSFSPIPSFVDTGALLIDKSNVEEFKSSLQSETQK